MMNRSNIILCLLLLFLVSVATLLFIGCSTPGKNLAPQPGFNITFVNDTTEAAVYRLARIDHNYTYPNGMPHLGPVELAVGEVQPGTSNEVNQGYPPGIWSITWHSCCGATEDWEVYDEYVITPDTGTLVSILQDTDISPPVVDKSKGI